MRCGCSSLRAKKEWTLIQEKRAARIAFYAHLNVPICSDVRNGRYAARRIYVEHCIREGIDIEKADARRDRQHKKRMEKWSECPGCHKEMQIRSIAKHQAKACKAVVPPLVEVPP